MSRVDLTQQDIEHIISIIKAASDVTDFSLKYGMLEIQISRGETRGGHAIPGAAAPPSEPPVRPVTAAPSPAPPSTAAPSGTAPHEPAASPALGATEFTINAPMVGTFYRAPAPGETPFVEAGQAVEGETVLCIIEVMKLMNSIAARRKGRVKRILVEDGEPVEFGQVLMILEAVD